MMKPEQASSEFASYNTKQMEVNARSELLYASSDHLLKTTFWKFRAVSFARGHKYSDHVATGDDPLVGSERAAVTKASFGKKTQNSKWAVHDFPNQPIVCTWIPSPGLHANGLRLTH